MSELSMSMFLNKADLAAARVIEAQDEALIASRIKAAAVVTKLQQSGVHWIFTTKPEESE